MEASLVDDTDLDLILNQVIPSLFIETRGWVRPDSLEK